MNSATNTFVKTCKTGFEICIAETVDNKIFFNIYCTENIRTKPHFLIAANLTEKNCMKAIKSYCERKNIFDFVLAGFEGFYYYVKESKKGDFLQKGDILKADFGPVYDWQNDFGFLVEG